MYETSHTIVHGTLSAYQTNAQDAHYCVLSLRLHVYAVVCVTWSCVAV
jgi:hypothetical protein